MRKRKKNPPQYQYEQHNDVISIQLYTVTHTQRTYNLLEPIVRPWCMSEHTVVQLFIIPAFIPVRPQANFSLQHCRKRHIRWCRWQSHHDAQQPPPSQSERCDLVQCRNNRDATWQFLGPAASQRQWGRGKRNLMFLEQVRFHIYWEQ